MKNANHLYPHVKNPAKKIFRVWVSILGVPILKRKKNSGGYATAITDKLKLVLEFYLFTTFYNFAYFVESFAFCF